MLIIIYYDEGQIYISISCRFSINGSMGGGGGVDIDKSVPI